MSKRDNLVWLDLEMTGLDPKKHRIIEIATIVTDSNLNVIAEGPTIAIHQSARALKAMDEWNVSHHTASGLVERVKESQLKEKQAEAVTLDFLLNHTAAGKSPLCGNTIYHDRKFLAKWMPKLEAHFHYRNIDVSSIKELVKRWAPDIAKGLVNRSHHRALSDVYNSIAELKYYREKVFRI